MGKLGYPMTTTTTVTLVTRDATLDNLSVSDYRDIFTELRQNLSLDKLIGVMASQYSKATWSKYERGEMELNRTMRSELRRAVNLPALPETVTEAVGNRTSPDAAVWMVGNGTAHQVLLVGAHDDLTLHVNGGVMVAEEAIAHSVPCNLGYTGATPRKPLIRPVASKTQNERRTALVASWREVIDAGLTAMEAKQA